MAKKRMERKGREVSGRGQTLWGHMSGYSLCSNLMVPRKRSGLKQELNKSFACENESPGCSLANGEGRVECRLRHPCPDRTVPWRKLVVA